MISYNRVAYQIQDVTAQKMSKVKQHSLIYSSHYPKEHQSEDNSPESSI